jgi:hypothetical protein
MFLILAFAMCGVWSVAVIAGGDWFLTPIALAMVAATRFMTRRMERLAIVADGDNLVVTNFWRERRLRRADVQAFAIETILISRRRTLTVKLKDFTAVRCDVMGPIRGERTRSDIEACRAELTAWLTLNS